MVIAGPYGNHGIPQFSNLLIRLDPQLQDAVPSGDLGLFTEMCDRDFDKEWTCDTLPEQKNVGHKSVMALFQLRRVEPLSQIDLAKLSKGATNS